MWLNYWFLNFNAGEYTGKIILVEHSGRISKANLEVHLPVLIIRLLSLSGMRQT